MLYRSFHRAEDMKGIDLKRLAVDLQQMDQLKAAVANSTTAAEKIDALMSAADRLMKERMRMALTKRIEMVTSAAYLRLPHAVWQFPSRLCAHWPFCVRCFWLFAVLCSLGSSSAA